MKNIFKLLLLSMAVIALYSSCKKVDSLPFYSNGKPSVLSSSANVIAPMVADSNKEVVTFSWTSPKYATDSANQKFIIEIDSSGRNFSKEATMVVNGALSKTLLAKEINNILLGFGFAFNTPYDVDVRVTSSYANNNEQYQSNVLKLKMTPYVTPPIVVPPASNTLFIIGSATASGWNYNPVPVPAQKFTRIDSVTYEGSFFLNGGQQYLLLPNGDWNSKYAVQDNSIAGLGAGGNFGLNSGSDFNANFPGPAATGMYTIKVDFQHGKFTVTPVGTYGLMYVPGDYQGWAPATASTLGSPKNDGNYDGYVNIPAGGSYQFKLNTSPDWDNSFGDGGSGTLSSSGGNMTVPAGGYYHIEANTVAKTWSATKTTWGIIGGFAASNWGSDVDMVYSSSNNNWTATITTAAGDQFKFRANHDWGLNYGETNGTGSLALNGDNIGDASKNFAVPAGTHTIILFLGNSGYYTYLIQ
ncbi:MAG: SusE domain-containing protein [Ginsengibacter sp.]